MKSKVLLSGAVALAMATAVMGPVATKSVNVYAAETTQNQQATQNQETTKNVEASKNVLTGNVVTMQRIHMTKTRKQL